MYLWKWYDKRLMGWWNVRNSEEKGGWKYDIYESQHPPQLNLLHVLMQPCMGLFKNIWHLELWLYMMMSFNNECLQDMWKTWVTTYIFLWLVLVWQPWIWLVLVWQPWIQRMLVLVLTTFISFYVLFSSIIM